MGYTLATDAVTNTDPPSVLTITPGSNRGVAVYGAMAGGDDTATVAGRYKLARLTGGATPTALTPEKTSSRMPAADVTGATGWGTEPTVSGNPIISMGRFVATTVVGHRRWTAPNPRYPIVEMPSGSKLGLTDNGSGGINLARQMSWGEADSPGATAFGRYRGRRATRAAGFFIQDGSWGFAGVSTQPKNKPGSHGYCFVNALDWPAPSPATSTTFYTLLNGSNQIDYIGGDASSSWGQAGTLTGVGAVALSGASPSSSWGQAGTLAASPVALAGSSPVSTWGQAGAIAAVSAALAGVSPHSTWAEAGALTGAGSVALTGGSSLSTWGQAGTLAPGPVALAGTSPHSTWGEDGSLVALGGPQALSGLSPASSWGEAGTLAGAGAVALAGGSPQSTWQEAGDLQAISAALAGVSPFSTWGEAGTLSESEPPPTDGRNSPSRFRHRNAPFPQRGPLALPRHLRRRK